MDAGETGRWARAGGTHVGTGKAGPAGKVILGEAVDAKSGIGAARAPRGTERANSSGGIELVAAKAAQAEGGIETALAEGRECAFHAVCSIEVVAAFAGEAGGIGALQTVGLQVLAFIARVRRAEVVVVDAAGEAETGRSTGQAISRALKAGSAVEEVAGDTVCASRCSGAARARAGAGKAGIAAGVEGHDAAEAGGGGAGQAVGGTAGAGACVSEEVGLHALGAGGGVSAVGAFGNGAAPAGEVGGLDVVAQDAAEARCRVVAAEAVADRAGHAGASGEVEVRVAASAGGGIAAGEAVGDGLARRAYIRLQVEQRRACSANTCTIAKHAVGKRKVAQHTKPCSQVKPVAVATGEAVGGIGAREAARNSSGTGGACEIDFVSTSGAGLAAALVDLD